MKRTQWLIIILVILIFLSLACVGGGDPTPTPYPMGNPAVQTEAARNWEIQLTAMNKATNP